MTRLSLFVLIVMTLFNCVPAKKLVYLQHDDLSHRSAIPKDTILRTHPLKINEYRIQPLDILNINFETLGDESDDFDFLPKLSAQRVAGGGANAAVLTGILVNAQGEIEYAVLGKIKVEGLTLFQAQDTIRKVASQYINDVVVRVRMMNFRVTVLGEVNGEGIVGSSNPRLTMMEAVGLAGGLTDLADRTHLKIIRQRGYETDVLYVNLLQEDFIESPNFYLQQNDIIIVPPLKQRTFRKYFVGNLGIITTTLSFVFFILTLSN